MTNLGFLRRTLLYMLRNFHSHSMKWSVLSWWAMLMCSSPTFQRLCEIGGSHCSVAEDCKSSGMWHCVIWWVALDVSKEHSAFIFTLKMKALCSFETLGNTQWCSITPQETWSLRECVCIGSKCYTACLHTVFVLTLHSQTCYPHSNTFMSLKLPAGTSGYMDHLVKETIQTELHLNNFSQDRDLA
jgi:hypothetical protein